MILLVSHDAGGAELLSSYSRYSSETKGYCLDGPAKGIFTRKLGTVSEYDLASGIEKADWVLTGTSWSSDIEVKAILAARAAGIKVVSFLDHWVNYRERFKRNGRLVLPDEIWVGDDYALELACGLFGNLKIVKQPNPYLIDLKAELSTIGVSSSNSRKILYVCEPIREHALLSFGNERHWGYTEEDALEWFLDNYSRASLECETIIIRPHPSESHDKYAWVASKYGNLIRFSKESSLLQDIVSSSMVVGCESMAMVVGLLAERRVICSIPPGGRPCTLPHQEIEQMQFLLQ